MATKPAGEKKGYEPISRTAEVPGQPLNVDLCFVPADHQIQQNLPAVSGSSGRLVVVPERPENGEPDYPGRIFATAGLDYETAMTEFVARSQAKPIDSRDQADPLEPAALTLKAHKRRLRQDQATLTNQRRQIRAQRRLKAARRQSSS